MAARQTYTVAINAETKGAIRGLNNLNSALKVAVGLFASKQILDFGKKLTEVTKQFQTMENQLRLVTNSQKELDATFKKLQATAVANRTSLQDTVDLFTKITVSTEELGISQDRVVDVTSKLSRALQLAGADGNTASAVIRQFGQAMASGEVRGDEFRSLVEGLGPALSIMARESGITVGKLREMSQAGELTAMTMFELLENSNALNTAFNKQKPTLESIEIAFGDAFNLALKKTDELIGVSSTYEKVLVKITGLLNDFAAEPNQFVGMSVEDILLQADTIGEMEDAIEALRGQYLRMLDLGPLSLLFDQEGIKKLLDGEIPRLEEGLIILQQRQKLLEESQLEQTKATQLQTFRLMEAAHGTEFYRKEQEKLNKAIDDSLKPFADAIKAAKDFVPTDNRTRLEKLNDELKEQEQLLKELTGALILLDSAQNDNSEQYKEVKELIAKVNQEKVVLEDLIRKEIKANEDAQKALEEREKKERDAELRKIKNYDDQILRIKRIQEADAEAHFHRMVQAKELSEEQQSIADFEKKTTAEKTAFVIDQGRQTFEGIGKFNKKAFQLYKAFAIAQAIQNTYLGATKALASFPPPFNFIAAAGVIGTGLGQVATIRNQSFSGRRTGGPVQDGRPFMVGESGPELFVPNQNGTILNSNQMGNMGGTVNVTFNIDATDADGFDTLLVQRKNTIVSMVRQAVQQGRLA